MRTLTPRENKHYKNVNTGDIYEGTLYLGKYDTPLNYVEVSEEEYQAYLDENKINE